MEQRTVSEIIEKFQPLLRKFEDDQNLLILDAKDEAGTKLGDNYMSIVIKTKITGKRGNGEHYDKSFMTKIFPRHREIAAVLRVDELFRNEAFVYNQILPALGPFGPRCVYIDDENIIMEDLRDKGYGVCDRRNFLDLDHCIFTVQMLARFHAKSLALKFKDPLTFEKLVSHVKEYIFLQSSKQCAGESINGCVRVSLKFLKLIENRPKAVDDVLEYMESNSDQYFDILQELLHLPKTKSHCFCHGDMWINNLLYKYDENGKIEDMKFIDYQILRYNSPSLDFLYFVYTSARSSVLEKHYDTLVGTYHRSLVQSLKTSELKGVEISKDFSLKWWQDELQKYSIFGLFSGFWLIHAVLAGETDVIDMDKLTTEEFQNLEEIELPATPEKLERMKQIVMHYRKHYFRDNN